MTGHTPSEHECVFVEEQEPGGRLILGPCLTCGTTAMDALNQQREALTTIVAAWEREHGEITDAEARQAARELGLL